MLIQGRNRKRREFPDPDDECDNDSTAAPGDAAAAVRVYQGSRSRSSDEDDESSQSPLLCIDQARSEGAVGSQAGQGQNRTEKKEGKEEGGSCGGFRHGETESGVESSGELAHGFVGSGADAADGEEDETDEELAGGTGAGACGTTLEEEDVETDEEIEMSTRDRTRHDRQPQEEDSEAEADPDADELDKGVDNPADHLIGSSPPPVNDVPSQNVQQVEPNRERASTESLENDDEENTRSSSAEEGKRTHGAGAVQGGFAPPSPVLQVPPTMQVKRCFLERWQGGGKLKTVSDSAQHLSLVSHPVPPTQGTTDTCDGQDASSGGRNEAGPRQDDDGTRDGVVDGTVEDNQPSGRPTQFMRVYGSAGITRVRESMAAWFSQRHPNP